MARTVWLDVVVTEKKAVGLIPRGTDSWEQRKAVSGHNQKSKAGQLWDADFPGSLSAHMLW